VDLKSLLLCSDDKIVRVLRTEFDGLAETDGDGHGEKFLGL